MPEREHDHEFELLVMAFDDALVRMSEVTENDSELVNLTNSGTRQEIEKYLMDHEADLNYQEKHFLRISIAIKKHKEQINS